MMLVAVAAHAQDDLNRQVNVAKDYAPTVDRARKLAIEPVLGDTVRLHPEFDYTVRPRAWVTGFGVEPIRPARVESGRFTPQSPFYLKAGGGYPGQSLLDFYANTTGKGGNSLSFYLNHRGQYSKIDNHADMESDAKSTINTAGLCGKVAFGRMSLAGEIGWDYDILSYYGQNYITKALYSSGSPFFGYIYGYEDVPRGKSVMQHYSTPRLSLVAGHDFTDLSYLNFRIGADGYLLDDRYDHKETGGAAFIELGKRFNGHTVLLRAEADFWKGGGLNSNAGGTLVRVEPSYEYSNGRFLFRLGAGFAYDAPRKGVPVDEDNLLAPEGADMMWTIRNSGEMSGYEYTSYVTEMNDSKLWFLPQFEFHYAVADGVFTPYVTLDSRATANSFRNMAQLNPYLHTEIEMLTATQANVRYDLRGGFSGSVAGVFAYNLYAGYSRQRNMPIIDGLDGLSASTTEGVGCVYAVTDKIKSFVFGGELEGRIGDSFRVALAGEINDYKSLEMEEDGVKYKEKVDFLPGYRASLEVKYNHGDKFHLTAGVNVRDGYRFDVFDGRKDKKNEAPTAANVYLTADYFVSPRFGIFLEGRNLANQDLYPYPFYRGVGLNLSAGVKLKF